MEETTISSLVSLYLRVSRVKRGTNQTTAKGDNTNQSRVSRTTILYKLSLHSSYIKYISRDRSAMGFFDKFFVSSQEWDNQEKTELPSGVPAVDEVGATSAPLLSASYFIGARCKPYNDDFMMCKDENNGGTLECLKEGRRVTRCAISVLNDINKFCFNEFKLHYECLEQENQKLGSCRATEKIFSKCVFDNLNLEKKVPDVKDQIHLKENRIYSGTGYDTKAAKAFLDDSKQSAAESSA